MSDFRIQRFPSAHKSTRVAIIYTQFNPQYVAKLLSSSLDGFARCGIEKSNITEWCVPGALEIPGLVRDLQNSELYDGILALGIVVRGGTNHYEIVTEETSRGIMDCTLSSSIPVINGVLGGNDEKQIENRLSKGEGFAASLVEMILLKKRV